MNVLVRVEVVIQLKCLAVDSDGLLAYFELPEGQRHDLVHAENLVRNLPEMKTVIAAKGYDIDGFCTFVMLNGGKSIISNWNYGADIAKNTIHWCLYKYRYLVENAFAGIKYYIYFNKIRCVVT